MRDASQCSTSAILIRPIDKIVKLVKAFYQKKKLLGPGEVVGWEMAPHKRDGNRIRHRMPNTASARSTHRNSGKTLARRWLTVWVRLGSYALGLQGVKTAGAVPRATRQNSTSRAKLEVSNGILQRRRNRWISSVCNDLDQTQH